MPLHLDFPIGIQPCEIDGRAVFPVHVGKTSGGTYFEGIGPGGQLSDIFAVPVNGFIAVQLRLAVLQDNLDHALGERAGLLNDKRIPTDEISLVQLHAEAHTRLIRRLVRRQIVFPVTVAGFTPQRVDGLYFGSIRDNLDTALASECSELHLDLYAVPTQLSGVLAALPEHMHLSLGVVDGRNIWKTNCAAALSSLRNAALKLGSDRLFVGSSSSLLHVPVDLELETSLDPEIRNWMAFTVQKCGEIALLGQTIDGEWSPECLNENRLAIESRHLNMKTFDPAVRRRCRKVTPEMLNRKSPYADRCRKQQEALNLPLFPTTTIGSYPQTEAIRKARREYRKGELSPAAYEAFLKDTIREIVGHQEALGLDVLVHGEPERTDMVEYFGQQLEGFCFTDHGWVQSYGSRCVKPPVLYGDVSGKQPMTASWLAYTQNLTRKPMKGMLTGPVTILCWSFVRDALEREEVCRQLALALRDEVLDLERAGLKIIQIDEAALREGLPLRKDEAEKYLQWAIDAFRLTVSGVEDTTQIHTHMCYSEFNAILKWIAAMDADVISIEASRSNMDLLQAFVDFKYPSTIGPGVYDI